MLRISQNIKYKDISVKVTDSPSANSNSKKNYALSDPMCYGIIKY